MLLTQIKIFNYTFLKNCCITFKGVFLDCVINYNFLQKYARLRDTLTTSTTVKIFDILFKFSHGSKLVDCDN